MLRFCRKIMRKRVPFMNNIPLLKIGLIAVSRDNFPKGLSEQRRNALAQACKEAAVPVIVCTTVVESEEDSAKAVREMQGLEVNALVVYLGNFGPETPETIIAGIFTGPVLYLAAAEGDGNLTDGRGDAYCGLLNCSYNLGLRNLGGIIPERPVGSAAELAATIRAYVPVLRTLTALRSLKLITFGPRPQDFLACNAPVKPLYDLGIEIQENSELDLLAAYNEFDNENMINEIDEQMREELCLSNEYPNKEMLHCCAKLEAVLLSWANHNRGSRKYTAFANKCWPAFQHAFGFCPCYVNSHMAGKGIPVGCETDIYGALSQYIGTAATGASCTLLDINNTVPQAYAANLRYPLSDLFMAFHCGNTPMERLCNGQLTYHKIMKRLLEPDCAPCKTMGTLEGNIAASQATMFRLQAAADGKLQAYTAQGKFLDADCHSFGGIGMLAIPQMERFYRNVLIEKHFPHHAAIAFENIGGTLFRVFKSLCISDISFNRPAGNLYPDENPYTV